MKSGDAKYGTESENSSKIKKALAAAILAKAPDETYWSIGFRTGRLSYAIRYVLFPLIVFGFFVIAPLYAFEPQVFSRVDFTQMSDFERSQFFAKLPIVVLVLFLPFCISLAMMIVGQIKRFHDIGFSAWICVLNVIPFAPFVISFALCLIPGSKKTNRFGAPPKD